MLLKNQFESSARHVQFLDQIADSQRLPPVAHDQSSSLCDDIVFRQPYDLALMYHEILLDDLATTRNDQVNRPLQRTVILIRL